MVLINFSPKSSCPGRNPIDSFFISDTRELNVFKEPLSGFDWGRAVLEELTDIIRANADFCVGGRTE
jgi:hypothetical protein